MGDVIAFPKGMTRVTLESDRVVVEAVNEDNGGMIRVELAWRFKEEAVSYGGVTAYRVSLSGHTADGKPATLVTYTPSIMDLLQKTGFIAEIEEDPDKGK
ncbi:hypothetical protein GJ688_18640 [Heliobacillus mobilis]|uniref:Uncharacterized protein n=1 Tax=Heliobacterium mobile TaxID=28064 RepID=A0A6I3SPI1_HELMO|nr:hypothetical protein [Heliobacterium mobile]MTV50938.1 hypothetical protein [Heliobacterium mobile]